MGTTKSNAKHMPIPVPSMSVSEMLERVNLLKRSRNDDPQAEPSSNAAGSSKPEPAEGELGTEAEVKPDAVAGPKPEEVSKPEASTTTMPAPEPTTSVKNVESSPTDLLKNLIDMTHVPSGTEPAHFNSIAQTLTQGFELCVTSKSSAITAYEFLEVEFYWYFHRAPRRVPPNSQSTAPVPSPRTSGFRAGTRKGLDLTFGVPANDSTTVAYGGILLRTLRNTETKKVTCGPSLLVDEVLRSAGIDSLPTLVEAIWKGDTSAFLAEGAEPGPSRVFLRPMERKSAKLPKMYTSPRIGLELSRIQTPGEATATHPRVQYVTRPYRFFTHPELMGTIRPQTFYGLLQAHEAGQLTRSGIADVSGMKPMQVPTFCGYVDEGRKAGPKAVKDFVGEKGKGVGPVAAKFLKMAGIVECILDDSGGERVLKKQKVGPTLTSMFASGSKSKGTKQG